MTSISHDFWLDKTVLITGHTGFVGSWTSMCLLMLGAKLIGYSLPPPIKPSFFEAVGLSRKMVSIEADIRDFDYLLSVLREYKPEIIIHLAAQPLVRESYNDPVLTYSTNVLGTVNLLEAVRLTDSTKVALNVTTDKCYENKEWVWGYRENDRLGGHDPYSSSKACSELVTQAYRDSFFILKDLNTHQVAVSTARAGNIIGGGDWANDRLIPDCIKALIENKKIIIRYPKAIRPWQHALEPIYGYLLLVEKLYKNRSEYSNSWNFGPDESDAKSVEWVVEYIANLWGDLASWGVDTNDNLHETTTLKLDCSKARSQLGWEPMWNIKTALERTVEWYKVYYERPQKSREVTQLQISEYFGLVSNANLSPIG